MVDSVNPQLLSYDTTFQLGDFYVSSLLFRHTIFKESPVIPALFLIHERNFKVPMKFFSVLQKKRFQTFQEVFIQLSLMRKKQLTTLSQILSQMQGGFGAGITSFAELGTGFVLNSKVQDFIADL